MYYGIQKNNDQNINLEEAESFQLSKKVIHCKIKEMRQLFAILFEYHGAGVSFKILIIECLKFIGIVGLFD